MTIALRHRMPLVLINSLIDGGGDPGVLTIDQRVWLGGSTHRILHPLPATDGRLTMRAIREEMERHRAAQWEVLAVIAPYREHFLLCFGMGLAARFDSYATRWSHDIDLLVDSLASGERIAEVLTQHGFSLDEYRLVDSDMEVADWALDRTDRQGGLLHVDFSCGGISNSVSWMPTLRLPDVFEQRREAVYGDMMCYVPSDLHQIILIAHKAQRNLIFDARTVSDIAILLKCGDIDEAELWSAADSYRLTGATSWLAGQPWRGSSIERVIIAIASCLRPDHHHTRQMAKWLYSTIWKP